MDQVPFQDEIRDNHCWGCSPFNEHGLQIKSFWSGDEAVCTWRPREYHMAGPSHVLNGGIIGSVIDCHCICTAIAAAYKAEGRPINSEPLIFYATAMLQVSYLRPTPINLQVVLRARIKEMTDRKTVLSCLLTAEDEECAQAEVVAVRVPTEWYHPRS
ncbi:MAG: PaaI family thioesterase [Dehalococcoidia bacterium]